jgi:stearoyl-CoA desaturase (delta-9 desaturase)
MQTFFCHRYAAHEMFSMSKSWEKVFYFFTWLFQGSSYLSARSYGILHRMHHFYVDTEDDVHSPKHDKEIIKMMLKTRNIYNSIHFGVLKVDSRFLNNLPDWKSFDKFASHTISRILWGFLYIGFYIEFATEWWMYLFLPFHFISSPIHGVIINWFAHKIGYRNHDVEDTSTNLFPIDLIMLGEGLHNNHHRMSLRANFAQKWFEFDPTYVIILLFDKLGIIQLKKQ